MVDFKLYAITDRHRCAPKPLFEVISELLAVGVRAIQLREKDLGDAALYQLAKPISALCRNYKAQLFINTAVQVALDVGATGVHLPANAESVGSVKARAGCNLRIGCSVHCFEAAKKREAEGADFFTYSPIYTTASKPGYGPAVGVVNLTRLAKHVKSPIFALSGITPMRVAECLKAGAFGVAVMSGVMSPTSAGNSARSYLDALCGSDEMYRVYSDLTCFLNSPQGISKK